jgi:putative hydrolase of the HAD superfamily
MIKGVIFDLGGTLMHFDADWEAEDQVCVANLVAFLRSENITTGGDFYQLFLDQRKRQWKRAEELGVEARIQDALHDALAARGYDVRDGLLTRAVETYFAHNETFWLAYPDALDTLRVLKARGVRLGLISNADDDGVVHRAVKRLGMAAYLDPVHSSSAEPRWRKPDPRIFHLVSAAWQIPPNEIAMVGDSPRYDILGAHRAGMRGILIDRGDNAPWQKIPDELAGDPAIHADATVHALAEIPGLLDSTT